jgi:hypothetical protein
LRAAFGEAWREELVGMLSMEDKARGGRSRADTAL